MVLDQAGWHRAGTLVVMSNILLVTLPPFASQLNSIEPGCLYLQGRFLSAACSPTATPSSTSPRGPESASLQKRAASPRSFHTHGFHEAKAGGMA